MASLWSSSVSSYSFPSLYACNLISSYNDTHHIRLQPHFNFIVSLKPYLQIQSYSEVLGIRISIYKCLEDTVQPITCVIKTAEKIRDLNNYKITIKYYFLSKYRATYYTFSLTSLISSYSFTYD